MKWTDLQLVGGAYSDDTRMFSVQDTVNFIPVYAEKEGTRSPAMLRCAPGYLQFCDLKTNAPIRGAHNAEGTFLAASSNKLFQVNPDGTARTIGTIPGVGRVIMAHNQVTGGNEVAISNGSAGYVYNTNDKTLVQITDEGFPGAKSFDYLDSYMMGVEPAGRFGFWSDLAAATSYNTLDRAEAEGLPDKIVAQIVSHREWWLFGERSIEVFANTGEQTGTFQRTSGTGIEVGAASPYCVAKLDNSVFWLSNDGIVYRANGYSPQRVSTYPIEQAIARCTMSSAFAFTYEDRGHKIYYLTLKDGQTWGYDVATQEWHRRESRDLRRWRINTLNSWNGKWLAGDFSNGRIYALDWDIQTEDGIPMERRRVTGVLADQANNVLVNAFRVMIDTGNPVNDPVPDRGIDPVQDLVKYLVVPTSDTTDYSSPTFDDSNWARGLAPFANAINADAAAHGFPASPATNWPLTTNLWYRSTVLLNPVADLLARIYVDDGVQVFVNGTKVYEYIPLVAEHPFYHEFTIPAAALVNGNNVFAFKSLEIFGALSYFCFEVTS